MVHNILHNSRERLRISLSAKLTSMLEEALENTMTPSITLLKSSTISEDAILNIEKIFIKDFDKKIELVPQAVEALLDEAEQKGVENAAKLFAPVCSF